MISKVSSKSVLSFLPKQFTIENFKSYYAIPIPAIDFESLPLGCCLPPPARRRRGRPSTVRIPSAYEGRTKGTKKCRHCKQSGHIFDHVLSKIHLNKFFSSLILRNNLGNLPELFWKLSIWASCPNCIKPKLLPEL